MLKLCMYLSVVCVQELIPQCFTTRCILPKRAGSWSDIPHSKSTKSIDASTEMINLARCPEWTCFGSQHNRRRQRCKLISPSEIKHNNSFGYWYLVDTGKTAPQLARRFREQATAQRLVNIWIRLFTSWKCFKIFSVSSAYPTLRLSARSFASLCIWKTFLEWLHLRFCFRDTLWSKVYL